MHLYLSQDVENIVVVNCRAGKGRTGTIICCLLMYTGVFPTPDKAMRYYSKKRFNSASGVTQPSQVRYVKYFYAALNKLLPFPKAKRIAGIYLNKFPIGESADSMRPYLEVFIDNKEKTSFTDKNSFVKQKKIYSSNSKIPIEITDSEFSLSICGDITIKMYNNRMLGKTKLGRISFNTNFIEENQKFIIYTLDEIDPDNFGDSEAIPLNFEIHVKIKPICNCEGLNICPECESLVGPKLEEWKEMQYFIEVEP